MDIFNVLALIGGLALFLFGMNVMGDGLTKAAGSKMERILEKLTSTPIKGVLLGAAVTGVIQSSSATTVMVVGFVNSGIMKLNQAVGIIMGANIGTTVTSWILSLTGIEGDALWIQLLKPTSFSPILAVVGIAFLMFSKSEKKHDVGLILLGFTILMYGMDAMSDAVSPLADVPEFANILLMFSNPILGLLAGMLLTAIIQSSSASVGILQALCLTGSVTYSTALPIIMGQNIGTCVTALLSCIGAKREAKRAAFVHLYFNVIGTTLFMIVFYSIHAFVQFQTLAEAASPAGIAVIHSMFNIVTTAFLLPFNKGLAKLATLTIPDKEEPVVEVAELVPLTHLDVRFLETPAIAVAQSASVMKQMASYTVEALDVSLELMKAYETEKRDRVESLEQTVDRYEDELGTYLAKISSRELSEEDSRMVATGLHMIGDLERISDHALAIAELYAKMDGEGMKFSDKATAELNLYSNAVYEIVDMMNQAIQERNLKVATRIEPLKDVIDGLNAAIKKQHIKRLQKGKCTIELGIALENLMNNYERVADHCSNIAVTLLQSGSGNFDTHEYLNRLKQEPNLEYQAMCTMFEKKYAL